MGDHTIHMGMAPTFSGGTLDYSNPIIPTIVTISEAGKYSIQEFKDADLLHLFEASSAVYWHKLLTIKKLVTEQELVAMIRAAELATGLRYIPPDFEYRTKEDDVVLYAAITSMSVQLVLVRSRELVLPESFLKWLRVASALSACDKYIWMNHLKRGLKLIAAFRRGLLPCVLTENLSSGLRWRDDYEGRPRVLPLETTQCEQVVPPNGP